jgi:quercetin dioxygenase-like cupin family protein
MPIDVIRFGVGHRRPDGPPGTRGIRGQVIHSDARGLVSELAFARGAVIEPHSNPNTTYFIVIEGGGWVLVGEERLRVAAGEAVVWPAGVIHGAWTDLTEMRAMVVEFAGADDAAAIGILPGVAKALPARGARPARGEGKLAPRREARDRREPSTGEPR